MSSYRVSFPREGICYDAQEGMTLLEVQIAAGIVPNAPCGGGGKCGKCTVIVDGKQVLACQTKVTGDVSVQTLAGERHAHILGQGAVQSVPFDPKPIPAGVEHPLLAAVDIGTTSVVVYLLDGQTGERLGVRSMLNPQRQFGGDVIARGSYAMANGGQELSRCIHGAVNDLLGQLTDRRQDVVDITMVGNSCMHHLFLGYPMDSLMLAPYTPVVTEAVCRPAAQCGITAHPDCQVRWLPNIGGFVGADTTGCMLAAGLPREGEVTLLVDIGTNGEMVLSMDGRMASCSTAAGPAFEGAKIECGMRGSDGAIDKVWVEDGTLRFHVIGDTAPMGLCGSGLLDAVRCLLEFGHVQPSGRMEETYVFATGVYLSQKDIRELQLAKAAIAAGVELLCAHMGITPEKIDRLLLAGAFGNYLDPVSACGIGLLPPVLLERIVPIGNAAGEGAVLAARNRGQWQKSQTLAREVTFLELAMDPEFQDVYVDQLPFGEEDDE